MGGDPHSPKERNINMRLRFAWLVALLALTCLAAWAADVDGKWTAEVQGGQTQTLTLKADGMKLTGTMEGGQGGPVEISEGMLHGSDVMFKVVREFNGNKFEQSYKGTLSGDELKLTREAAAGGKGRGPQDLTFKRAK
jgi:hypothetical protein